MRDKRGSTEEREERESHLDDSWFRDSSVASFFFWKSFLWIGLLIEFET